MDARIPIPDGTELSALLGPADEHLNLLRSAVDNVQLTAVRDAILLSGEPAQVGLAEKLLDDLLGVVRSGHALTRSQVEYAVRSYRGGETEKVGEQLTEVVLVTDRGKPIRARTPGQRRYVQAIDSHTITFGIGPAGTGKTYLAMACAIRALRAKEVSRIILCRPAVEAGERLGFLPGDLQAKIDPYLRPLYDALYDMVDIDRAQRHLERSVVEVAPLAFMRGRTLNDSFIILDEAQNTTAEQMKMFLTRLGFGSKAVVTGDLTQTDLPSGAVSGLHNAVEILDDISGIAVSRLGSQDVVRHELVQRIVEAYGRLQPKPPSRG
ncbi:MAG: PhoH family protein [Armatimonadetes bacterium]|nr:PhoH family protein [Armatimonadota bacterium]